MGSDLIYVLKVHLVYSIVVTLYGLVFLTKSIKFVRFYLLLYIILSRRGFNVE